jgi:hypothetical protein
MMPTSGESLSHQAALIDFGPSGKSPQPVIFRLSSPFRKNISVFPKRKFGYMICHPVPKEGRWPSSRTWGGERWTRRCRRAPVIAGRAWPVSDHTARRRTVLKRTQNRVVLTPQGWRQVSRRFCEPDRADKTIFARRRCQTSPIAGEHDISRKTIAQGMPDCLR